MLAGPAELGLPDFCSSPNAKVMGFVHSHPEETKGEDLAMVRELGHACYHEETLIGLCCLGAPIHDREGTVVAAISFSVPTYRFFAKKSEYITAICDAAGRISREARPALEE